MADSAGDRGLAEIERLCTQVAACAACADLPLGPRPIIQIGVGARILIAGQAPGRRTHLAGRPFDDASGERLRHWLGLDEATFRDPAKAAILPMGFSYPGTGRSGDLAPRPECAPLWRRQVLEALTNLRLTVVIGRHAQAWHLPDTMNLSLRDAMRDWRSRWPRGDPAAPPKPAQRRLVPAQCLVRGRRVAHAPDARHGTSW